MHSTIEAYEPELVAITALTLNLRQGHDFGCALESSEEMHKLLHGSDLRIFKESAHSIGGDEAQRMLRAVPRFLVRKMRASCQ